MSGLLFTSALAGDLSGVLALDDPSGCVDGATLDGELEALAHGTPFAFTSAVEVLAAPDGWLVDWRVASEGRRDRFGALTVEAGECGSAAHATFIAIREAVEGEWRVSAGLAIWVGASGAVGLPSNPSPGLSLGVFRAWSWDHVAVLVGGEGGWGSTTPIDALPGTSVSVHRLGAVVGIGRSLEIGGLTLLPTVEGFVGGAPVCRQDPEGGSCYLVVRAEPSLALRAVTRTVIVGARLASPLPRLAFDDGFDSVGYGLTLDDPMQVEAPLRALFELGFVLAGRTQHPVGLGGR